MERDVNMIAKKLGVTLINSGEEFLKSGFN